MQILFENCCKSMNVVKNLFQNYLERLDKTKKDSEYLYFVMSQIVPLIKKLQSSFVKKLEVSIDAFNKEINSLEKNICIEVKEILAKIENSLDKAGLLCNNEIQIKIQSINAILNATLHFDSEFDCPTGKLKEYKRNNLQKFKIVKMSQREQKAEQGERVFCMPPQFEIAVDRLKDLVNYIVTYLKQPNIVAENIILREQLKYVKSNDVYQCNTCFKLVSLKNSIKSKNAYHCPICNDLLQQTYEESLDSEFRIEEFNVENFVPSYFKKLSLEKEYENSVEAAWEMLLLIEQCYDPASRWFYKNKLHYNNAEEIARSRKLLIFEMLLFDVRNLKHDHINETAILKKDTISKYVKKVFSSFDTFIIEDFKILKLEIDDNNILILSLIRGIFRLDFQLHQFKNDKRLDFVKNLLNNPKQFIYFKSSKTPILKSLREIGFSKYMCDLFGIGADKSGATLNIIEIDLCKKTKQDMQKIIKYISSLSLSQDLRYADDHIFKHSST